MQSPAKNHYPHFRFRNGEKKLFNPVLKKTFANRPEERVRLRYTDYLLEEAGWGKNRIGFEIPVKLPQDANKVRADLMLYSDKTDPFALIECKAEAVKPGENAAVQIARYNSSLKAPYLMVTNGEQDHWFNYRDEKAVPAAAPVISNQQPLTVYENAGYWISRGFISAQTDPELHPFMIRLLKTFFTGENRVRYFDLSPDFLSFPAGHYYSVHRNNESYQSALTLSDSGSGSTNMIITVNKNGRNAGLIEISIDSLFTGSDEICLHLPGQEKKISRTLISGICLDKPDQTLIKKIPEQAVSLFD